MGENSKIEWTDHTFNPWTGCTKVSPGCANCYAEGWAKRSGRVAWGPQGERRRTSADNWRKPLKWDKAAAAAGRRAKVFCASLADVFEDHPTIDQQWRADLWALIAATPHLDWLLLTKRAANIARFLPDGWGMGYPNVWLGATVENQQQADERIPHLLSVSAAVRFLSCEPLLGPVDLRNVSHGLGGCLMKQATYTGTDIVHTPRIDWVIVGGESGPKARPMWPDWARSLRGQCAAAGVSFMFKQWGEFGPPQTEGHHRVINSGNGYGGRLTEHGKIIDAGNAVLRLGKATAGRLLDGAEHLGFPAAARDAVTFDGMDKAAWLEECGEHYIRRGGCTPERAEEFAMAAWETALADLGSESAVLAHLLPEDAADADMDYWGEG